MFTRVINRLQRGCHEGIYNGRFKDINYLLNIRFIGCILLKDVFLYSFFWFKLLYFVLKLHSTKSSSLMTDTGIALDIYFLSQRKEVNESLSVRTCKILHSTYVSVVTGYHTNVDIADVRFVSYCTLPSSGLQYHLKV